jgi:PAS domain S-box-containing protein
VVPALRIVPKPAHKDSGMSLKSFLTRLVWICVLPLVLLSAYLAVDHVRSLHAQRDLASANLARNFATSLDHLILARISSLQVLAGSPLLDDPARLSEFYREALAFKDSFNNDLLLADLSRRMLLITRMPYGAALPYLPTVQGHSAAEGVIATGRPAVGDTFVGPVSKERMISIGVPVERQGRTAFLLMSVMETRLFQKRLDEIDIPAGYSLAVLDGKGDLVAARPRARSGERPSAQEMAGRLVIKSTVSPWTVVLTEAGESRHATLLAAAAAMAAAILGATLVSFLGGRLAGRRLARSVASLAQPALPLAPGPAISEIEAVRTLLVASLAAREEAQATLRRSEERYRSLVESAPLAIFINRNGLIEYANPAALQLFGVATAEGLLGKGPRDFVHPDCHATMAERIRILLAGGSVGLAQTRIVQAGGAERNVEVVAAAFSDRQGPAVQVMMQDISERKLAEDALKEREGRLRRAEEMAHLGHWRRDLVREQVTWSDEMYRIFGLQPEDALPENRQDRIARFCHPDDLEPCLQSCDPEVEHGGNSFEYRIVRPDGEERHVVSRGELLRDEHGAPVALFGTLLDATELRRKERELQEKNAELERFTYMISHDLKSPLVTLKTFLGYLELDLAGGNAARVEKDLEFMRGAAERMGRLLDELLEMSRVGRKPNEPVVLSCAAVVNQAVALVAGSLSLRGVVVLAQLPKLTLFGDQARLVEIWQNLVENACKFMGGQPEPRLELGARGSGRNTVFYVRDNGIGIESQYLEKVFGLFEKLDRNAEGTGLGLALVRRIVELNGGKIWAESQGRGLGTCISFTLPGAVRDDWEGALS